MLVKLINKDAEKKFLEALENNSTKNISRGVLICRFSETIVNASPNNIALALKEILLDCDASIFFCTDGDIAISWKGNLSDTSDKIKKKLKVTFEKELENSDNIFDFYDTNAQGEELRVLFVNKGLSKKKEVVVAKQEPQPADLNIESYFSKVW